MILQILYLLFAAGAVIGGLNVVARRNPVNSAISLLFTFICVAALYILHGAPLLAMIQIIVYAGAILILVVFTIMLLALRAPGQGLGRFWTFPQKIAGLCAALVLAAEMLFLSARATFGTVAGGGMNLAELSSPAALGRVLFDKYLLPFEVASILLLVGIVGAVVLTRRPKGTAAAVDAPDAEETKGGGQ